MKNKKIYAILLMCLLVFLCGCQQYKFTPIYDNSNYDNSNYSAFFKSQNYSQEAYYKVYPEEKFIIYECYNSTLRFNNSAMWCEK